MEENIKILNKWNEKVKALGKLICVKPYVMINENTKLRLS